MQREIKFRAWLVKDSTMFYDVQNWYDYQNGAEEHSFGALLGNWKDYKVMQFTGLHDKNGKEIYEGDVVVLGDWKPKEIVFEGGSGFSGFKLKDTDCFLMGHDTNRLEVIGNIYENPLLIKPTLCKEK